MTVRWGFLGAGFIATRALAPAVASADGAVLQAVAARDVDRARSLQPAGAAYGGYDDLLADDEVDAVYISLANDAHAQWSTAAMRSGKDVLCEKPLAMTAAEVDAMAAVAAETGRLLVEASWYRWHPRTRLAQQLVAEGRVGTVRHAAAGFTFTAKFVGRFAGNYRLDPAHGGGALYDVGCYTASALQWAFGDAPVRLVAARQELGPTGIDVTTEAVLEFDDGDGEMRAGINEDERQWIVVTGDSGEIQLAAPSFASWHSDSELLVSDGTTTQRIPVAACDPYRLMVEEMSARIGGGDGWVLPLAVSRATAAILDAARASAAAGGAPTAPPPA